MVSKSGYTLKQNKMSIVTVKFQYLYFIRQTEEEVERQHQRMDRPRVRQAPEGSGEQRKIQKTGCKIICGATTTLTVQGLMMMMMMVTS